MKNDQKILVAHDDRLISTLITEALTKSGYITRQAEGGYATLSTARKFQPELVMISVGLPDMDLKEVLSELKALGERAPKVILLARKDTPIPDNLIGPGLPVDDSITWPLSNRELVTKVESLLRVREATIELVESKERYQTIFETVPISIWEEDFSWVIQKFDELRRSGVADLQKYMNEHPNFLKEAARNIIVKDVNPISIELFHAKDKNELLTSIDFYFSDFIKPFEEQLLAIWNKVRFYEVEVAHKTLDGRQIFVRLSIKFPETPEEYSHVYVLKTDITALKLASEQQKFFYDVLSASVNEIYTFDAETLKFVFVSKGALSNLGYSMEEMRQMTPVDIKPEFDLEKFNQLITPLTEGKQPLLEFQTVHQRADGTTYPVEVHLQKISLGRRAVFLAVIVDITERKIKEMELAHSRDLMRYIIENSKSSIAVLDKELRYLYVSQNFLRDYHATLKDIIGKTHYEVFPTLPQSYRDIHQRALRGETIRSDEDSFIGEDGEEIWSRWECRPWFDVNEKIAGIIIDSEVITDRVNAMRKLEESELKFRLLVENADLGVGYFDLDGKVLYFNTKAAETMGGGSNDFIGKSLQELFGEEAGGEYNKRILLAAEKEGSDHYEDFVPLPTGKKWFQSTYSRVMDSSGTIYGIQIISEDITDRKSAEEKLIASEEKFRFVFDSSNVGKSLTLPTGEVRANRALAAMLGYTQDELSQKTWQMLTPQEDIDSITKLLKPLIDGLQEGARFTKRYICKDGSILWGDVSTVLRRDAQGKPLHFITTVVDITDRRKAEESLQQTTQLLSLFIHNSPIYAYIKQVDPKESKVIFASENYIDMIGVHGSEMVGKTMGELFPLEFATKISMDDWNVVHKGETLKLEEALNDRSYISLKFPINLGSKQLLAGYTVDITDLKQTEGRLRELTHRQEALLGAIPDILMETDLEKVYTWANPAGLEFFGKDVVGHEAAEYFLGKQDTYKVVDRLFKGDERTIYVESWQRRADGEKRLLAWWCRVVLDAEGKPIGALSTARDITEKQLEEEQIRQLNAQLEQRVEERTSELREAQEQIVRKEKLAFLGQIAGSVGHELRNPLAVIANAVYYLRMVNSDADEKVKKYLDMIELETRGAEKIISDLLEFARTKSVERTQSKIEDLVMHAMKRRNIPETISVEIDLPHDLPSINVDPRHINQILDNLLTNACQAIKQDGRVKIFSRRLTREGRNYVGIVVSDTGEGIPPENMHKLFEPLFTTKTTGIGLGLSVCKKLAEANDGFIEVTSEVGKGSEFVLYLPVKD